MTWYALDVHADAERRPSVAAWLVARTGQAVEERADGTLVSFAKDLPEAEATGTALRQELGGGIGCSHRELPEVDWSTAWRAGLGVRRVGRFAIIPSWVAHAPASDAIPLVLDPEMAFGSGEHGSTRAALWLLDSVCKPGDTVLDFGSGSGILTIAAAKLGAARAIGIEVDGEALPVAERNAERNGVAGTAAFLEGDAAVITLLLGPADIVVSNILRLVNAALLPEIHAVLRPGGVAIFSGMEVSEAEAFRAPLVEGGFVIREEKIDEGWWAVSAVRP